MFSILKTEMYKTIHNKTFLILFIASILVSIPMTGVGVDHRVVHNVLVFDKGINDNYTEAIQTIISKNYFAKYDSTEDKYVIASEAMSLLLPGAELHSKYGWLLNEKHENKQYIEDNYYPINAENVYENWAFNRILTDNAAIYIFGIIFTIYFFGHDFSCRNYSLYIMSGKSRKDVVLGKCLIYFIFSFSLSLILLIIAIINYVPTITVLETGYIVRCILTKVILDIGFLFIPIIFPFIFRDVIKSMGVGFMAMILLFSNRAIIDLHLLDSYKNEALWLPAFSIEAFTMAVLTGICILIVTIVFSYTLFKRSELK